MPDASSSSRKSAAVRIGASSPRLLIEVRQDADQVARFLRIGRDRAPGLRAAEADAVRKAKPR